MELFKKDPLDLDYKETVTCPKCDHVFLNEHPFKLWMRKMAKSEPRLKTDHFVAFDCDQILHRYKTVSCDGWSYKIQAIMFLEVKTKKSRLSYSQDDTLKLFSAVMNDRPDIPPVDWVGSFLIGAPKITKAWSNKNKEWIELRMFGGHILWTSGNSPENSTEMTWNDHPITMEQLISLMNFDLDPYSMRPIDWKIHHAYKNAKQLEMFKCIHPPEPAPPLQVKGTL